MEQFWKMEERRREGGGEEGRKCVCVCVCAARKRELRVECERECVLCVCVACVTQKEKEEAGRLKERIEEFQEILTSATSWGGEGKGRT